MSADSRNPFGRPLNDPASLDFRDRVDCLRRLAGGLQASASAESKWLGRCLATWLHNGGDLLGSLGVRPAPGSRTTSQAVVRQALRDNALLRLSVAVGGDAQALRILAGTMPCPASAAGALADALRLKCPQSRAAFTRARGRASRHR